MAWTGPKSPVQRVLGQDAFNCGVAGFPMAWMWNGEHGEELGMIPSVGLEQLDPGKAIHSAVGA